jgi:hypothetical protein
MLALADAILQAGVGGGHGILPRSQAYTAAPTQLCSGSRSAAGW